MSELVLAAGIWHGAPSHSVTAATLTLDHKMLLTADTEGRICAWGITTASSSNATPSIRPKLMFLGPENPIVALAVASFETAEAVVSVCADGTVTLWDALDGYSQGTAPQLTEECRPQRAAVLPDARHLVVSGDAPFVQIVDLWSLAVVATLPAYDNWVSALAVSSIPSIKETHSSAALLVSVTASGSFRLAALDSPLDVERVLKRGRLTVGARVTSVAISPSTSSMVLLRGDTLYQYACEDLRPIAVAAAPVASDVWIGASYITDTHLLAWTSSGRIYRFSLPQCASLPIALSIPSSPIATIASRSSGTPQRPSSPAPTRNAAAETVNFAPLTDDTPRLTPTAELRSDAGSFAAFAHSKDGAVAIAVNAAADVVFWDAAAAVASLPAVAPVSPLIEAASGSARFASGWPDKEHDRVTACISLDSSLLLASGHASGRISITPLAQFEDRKERPFTPWQAHDGAINALCALTLSKSPLSLLASAGADCIVKVWDLASRACVASFAQHCAPVTHLLQPSELSLDGKWRGAFLSVGSDRTVCAYMLDPYECVALLSGHTGDVSAIRLRADQEYLLVECSDGSVSVWDLALNALETRLYGEEARAVIGTEEDLLHRDQRLVRYHGAGVAALPISSLRSSAFLVVLINIKREIASLKGTRKRSSAELPRLGTNPTSPSKDGPTSPRKLSSVTNSLATNAAGSARALLAMGLQLAKGVAVKSPADTTRDILQAESPSKGQLDTVALTTDSDELFAHMRAHTNFAALSLVLPWGVSAELDTLQREALALSPPSLPVSLALRGEDGLLSVLVPATRRDDARWTTSPHFSAVYSLAAAAIATVMLQVKSHFASSLLAHVCAHAPVETPGYAEPSLPMLSLYWRDSCEEVMLSARSLFSARVDRLTVLFSRALGERRSLMLSTWSAQLAASAGKGKWRTVLLMGILGGSGLGSDLFPDQLARATATELLALTASEVGLSLQVAAVELLSRGWRVWRKYVTDPLPFLRRLLSLSAVNEEYVAGTVSQALQDILFTAPTEALTSLRALFASRVLDASSYVGAITALYSALAAKPELFVDALHIIAELSVHVLDAKQVALRAACLRSVSQLVQVMLRLYPMCSLHQETQRLAVGSRQGVISLLDLRVGTRWAVLEGHKSAVSAVSWSKDGKLLASYAIEESTVYFWRTESGLFGLGAPHRANSWAVSRWERGMAAGPLVAGVKLDWTFSNVVCLLRGTEQPVSLVL